METEKQDGERRVRGDSERTERDIDRQTETVRHGILKKVAVRMGKRG